MGGETIRRTIAGSRGYLSQSELIVHIGTGKELVAEKVTVRWPGQADRQVWKNLAADKVHVLQQE